MTRILIAGGYGLVGGWIARHLRAAGHNIDLVLAGRTPDAGAALASALNASVIALDSGDAAAGLAKAGPVDLVIGALQDPDDNLLTAALRANSAFLGIVRKVDNVGPTAIAACLLARRPALLMGHWQAGAGTFAALVGAKAFGRLESIAMAALFDLADPAGTMATTDSSAFFTKALMRRRGVWERVDQADNIRQIDRPGLPSFMARPMGVLDVAGLAAMTGADDVRFDIGVGQSLGTIAGQQASHEIYVDLRGENILGRSFVQRIVVSDPLGQAHLTALGVLIGVERLLGLDGRARPAGGLHLPERLIEPRQALDRLCDFGVCIDMLAPPA